MNYNDFEKNVIHEYWKTLSRHTISTIPSNNYIKKPFLENYIINLSTIINNDELNNKIMNFIDKDKINTDEIILFISNNIDLNNTEKQNISNNPPYPILILKYQIKYFRFYQTIVELLFDNKKEDNELYYYIYLYIKNNKKDIQKYSKNNMKFMLFCNYLNDLLINYIKLFEKLVNDKIIINSYTQNEIFKFFIKNIFNNWYLIYKNDISENKFDDKCKTFKTKSNLGLFYKLSCVSNIH